MVKGKEATYTDFTRRTARYPKRKEKDYLMLGLMNEAGEVGGAYKKEIRDNIDADSLGYLSHSGLLKSVKEDSSAVCMGCFTGNHPIPVQLEMDKLSLEV